MAVSGTLALVLGGCSWFAAQQIAQQPFEHESVQFEASYSKFSTIFVRPEDPCKFENNISDMPYWTDSAAPAVDLRIIGGNVRCGSPEANDRLINAAKAFCTEHRIPLRDDVPGSVIWFEETLAIVYRACK